MVGPVVTMLDVARTAGVSTTTVSHVMNGTRNVSDRTSELVRQAIESTGYRHNSVARSLATSTTKTVGLAIAALTNPYFGPLVHALEDLFASAGFSLVFGDTHDEPARESRVVDQLLDRRVDGLLLAPSPGAADSVLPRVARSGTPLVLIDRFADTDCDQVAPENTASVRTLVDHLATLGHTRVAAVTGLEGLHSTVERTAAMRRAITDLALDDDPRLLAHGNSTARDARSAVRDLFGRGDGPTAVVVLNNAMTIGTMRGLKDLGLRVPDDVALVCFDDFDWADLFEPRLTAVRQDVQAMGALAVELLLARISDPDRPRQRLRVATSFQHRRSCGCASA